MPSAPALARTLPVVTLLLLLTACPGQQHEPDPADADTSPDTASRDATPDDAEETRDAGDLSPRDSFDRRSDSTTDRDTSEMDARDAEEVADSNDVIDPDTRVDVLDTATGARDTTDATERGDTTAPDIPDADTGGTPTGPWTRLIGSGGTESINDIAVSAAGEIYVCGGTDSAIGNQTYAGGLSDGWLAKYDTAGNRKWVRLFGSSFIDIAASITLDGGEVFVAGTAGGSIGGQTFRGGQTDGFLAQYDDRGNRQWARLIGTFEDDGFASVTVDASDNVFAVGQAGGSLAGQIHNGGPTDGLLARYDRLGNRTWVRLIGSRNRDILSSVAVAGPDRIFASGTAGGALNGQTFNGGGSDSLVTEYNKSGKRIWTRLPGTSEADSAYDVAVDSAGGRYVTGESTSPMSGNVQNYFLGKYDASGTRTWIRRSRMNVSGGEGGRGLAIDPAGSLILVGWTDHAFGGATGLQGPTDALVATYDAKGMRTKVRLVGGPAEQFAEAASLDGPHLYLGGLSTGGFGGATYGGGSADGFVAKLP